MTFHLLAMRDVDDLPSPITQTGRLLTADRFQRLAGVPPELKWFADLGNAATRRANELGGRLPAIRGFRRSARRQGRLKLGV
jgi:hypothetical protein